VAATGKHARLASKPLTPSSSQEEFENALSELDEELEETLEQDTEPPSAQPDPPTATRPIQDDETAPRKRRKESGGDFMASSIGKLANVMIDNLKRRETQYEQQGKTVFQRAILLLHDQHRAQGAPWLFQASHALGVGENAMIYLATTVENREEMVEQMVAAVEKSRV
jgi:hypothetical protein